MPICLLYPAFVGKHTERNKEIKSLGMTIVTVSSAPTLASTLSSSQSWSAGAGEPQEMLELGWCMQERNCCPSSLIFCKDCVGGLGC